MPLLGEDHSNLVRDEAPYFMSLAELDAWFAQPHDKLSGIAPYQLRPDVDGQSDSGGKLLVCHDYKGGYKEFPSGLCYTFNFWRFCDTFVYFSHHRVTVPPSGWVNAAHRQGTRILGTLIFEGHDNPDCLQLLVGDADYVVTDNKIPVSRRYAVLLAELAYQRGFDGYLLNFESSLRHGVDHAHALTTWILLLRSELRAKVGPHARVVWYDSVIINGWVIYQNRLNGYNLPFFLAADTFFTNYWWDPETQTSMAEYFTKLKRAGTNPDGPTELTLPAATKILGDIYSGVDVWPRNGGSGQYGCGFTSYRAITHTSPRGFGTALFGPGWTWEAKTQEPEENWDNWWDNERRFWLGPLEPGEVIPCPDCPEGPFKPITAFFQDLLPLNPSTSVFYTHFSPGVGYSWFVGGKKVLDTKKGWTDVDKQSSIGNLVWPWPTPSWKGDDKDEAPPTASTKLDMTDGYNGGNTLKLTLELAESKPKGTTRVIWLPVQSLVVTTRESFEARVVYKTIAPDGVDVKPRIYVKPLLGEHDSSVFAVGHVVVRDVSQGWTSQTVTFTSTTAGNTTSVAIGFFIDVNTKDPSAKLSFSLSLGQLAVYPTPPPSVSVGTPSITRAKFSLSPRASEAGADALEGELTWDVVSTFSRVDFPVDDAESTTPAWLLRDTPGNRFPKFVYFNVYVSPYDRASPPDPTSAVFVGTTGLDGRANRFYVEPACLPAGWHEWAGTRFYIQGVTDRGEVLPWEKCAITNHKKNKASV